MQNQDCQGFSTVDFHKISTFRFYKRKNVLNFVLEILSFCLFRRFPSCIIIVKDFRQKSPYPKHNPKTNAPQVLSLRGFIVRLFIASHGFYNILARGFIFVNGLLFVVDFVEKVHPLCVCHFGKGAA